METRGSFWPDHTVDVVLEGLNFPEGLFWSERDHCIYFVEWAGDTIWRLHGDRAEVVYRVDPGSGPCGLCHDAEGGLWVTLYSVGRLLHLDEEMRPAGGVEGYQGRSFVGPNQLVLTPSGHIIFTDSGDFEEDWRMGRPVGAIYALSPGGELAQADSSLCFPNGITLIEGGQSVVVNEHRRNRLLTYRVDRERLLDRRVLAGLDDNCLLPDERCFELGPDGSCADGQGNIWVAHYGGGKVVAFSPAGERLGQVMLPAGRRPTNVAYDPERGVLYVTESELGLLYAVRPGR
jgi:D-xylonolactonase